MSPSPSAGAAIVGTTCWGHVTGVLETNIRTFADNWTGTGAITGAGDAERLELGETEYMESEIVNTGARYVELLQNNYAAGDLVILQYRHAAAQGDVAGASYSEYSTPFISLGYVQVKVLNSL